MDVMDMGFGTGPPPIGDFGASRTTSPGASSEASAMTAHVSAGSAPPAATPQQAAVPAACLACRAKHLKCDGANPCSRCTSSYQECLYIASRRGYKGPRRQLGPSNPNKRHASDSPTEAGGPGEGCPMLLGAPVTPTVTASMAFNAAGMGDALSGSPYGGEGPQANPGNMQLFRFSAGTDGSAVALGPPAVAQHAFKTRQPTVAERCFDSFYRNFYGGHPFVLPRDYFLPLLKSGTVNLAAVMAAMNYAGCLYIDVGPAGATCLDEALRLVYLPTTPKDGFLVQALLILTVALDGSCQQEKARQLLADAERTALEIGLNTRQFAAVHGQGDAVLEESWRRTWWDLWICDGMVAGVHRVTNFFLFDVPTNVALPCEEAEYFSGNIPPSPDLEDFDDRLFSGDEREFSSFTYRIAAARNLGRLMRMPNIMFPDEATVDRLEASLSNWRMHLPPDKRDSLNKNCQLDEMMFQAHMITNACTIILHQPLSQLDTSPARAVTSCAPHRPTPSGDFFNAHTRHTLSAASEISKMVTHAVPLTSHTHFFTCVVTLSSIVHLSRWAMSFLPQPSPTSPPPPPTAVITNGVGSGSDDADALGGSLSGSVGGLLGGNNGSSSSGGGNGAVSEDDLRQQIRLNIGALNKLSEVWKAAARASGQVGGVARDVYRAKKTQQINPAFWVGFTQEEMIRSLSADDGIMSEFAGILEAAAAAAVVPGLQQGLQQHEQGQEQSQQQQQTAMPPHGAIMPQVTRTQ